MSKFWREVYEIVMWLDVQVGNLTQPRPRLEWLDTLWTIHVYEQVRFRVYGW